MSSPFSQGAQNADKAFSQFVDGDVTFFSVSLTTIQTQSSVAHGLSAAPDFVIAAGQYAGAASAASDLIGWSATATTLTVIANNTVAADVISVFAANIS